MKKHFIYIATALLIIGCIYFAFWLGKKQSSAIPNPHASHTIVSGDPSKRYTASFITEPAVVHSNQDVKLIFKIYDAANGNDVKDYSVIFDKLMHLVIVDSNLSYFDHIHPIKNGSEFSITTKLPHKDTYHLYINFQPKDGTEQQIGFTLPVDGGRNSGSNIPPDANLTKAFGNLKVSLSTTDSGSFNAQAMSDAAQILNFHFSDATSNQPISDLEPYLGAFGHLVMINEQTYQYIHIHPIASDNPNAGGPDVKFLPAALFEKIVPGTYRVFGQFKRNNQLFVADFTIKIE